MSCSRHQKHEVDIINQISKLAGSIKIIHFLKEAHDLSFNVSGVWSEPARSYSGAAAKLTMPFMLTKLPEDLKAIIIKMRFHNFSALFLNFSVINIRLIKLS